MISIRPGSFTIFLSEPNWETISGDLHKVEITNDDPGAINLYLCLNGKGQLKLGEQLHSVQRGSVWFSSSRSPAVWLEYDYPGLHLLHVELSIHRAQSDPYSHAKQLEEQLVEDFLSCPAAIGYDPALCDYNDFMKSHTHEKNHFGFSGVLSGLLLDAMRTAAHGRELTSDKERIIAFVKAHAQQHLTVADLAKFLSVSERSLFYFFQKNFQTSPNDFINRTRICSAAECLEHGIPVHEVSELYRFSETTSFCRMFKKYFGVTPSEYQRAPYPLPETSDK